MMNVCMRCLLSVTIFCGAAGLFEPVFAADYNFGPYTVIDAGESYDGGTIYITSASTIENHGTVNGATLSVCDGCNVHVENTNVFNASVTLGAGAAVTQVITTNDGITALGINVPYNVLIKDTSDALHWNAIVDNTVGATGYSLENAKLYMDSVVGADNVNVAGRIIVYADVTGNSDFVLFSNISGTGVVNVVLNNIDALHLAEPYMVGSDMHVRVFRSTDYARVLHDNTGVFLNSLREVAPDDALLAKLDTAKTFDEFNGVLSKSIKVHPIKMMQSLKTIYNHKMLETVHIAQNDGLGLTPIAIFSDDALIIGAEPYLNINPIEDLHMKIFANVFNVKYENDINSYNAMSYGLGADIVYDLPYNNFARVNGGLNLSSFDAGMVFDGNGATEKPNGISGYMVGEFAHKFDFDKDYYVSPFVMIGGDYVNILNSDELNGFVGMGVDTGFNFEFDGFRYDYMARGILRSTNIIGGELNISVWSLADSAGASLRGGILYDGDVATSYHIALDAKFDF